MSANNTTTAQQITLNCAFDPASIFNGDAFYLGFAGGSGGAASYETVTNFSVEDVTPALMENGAPEASTSAMALIAAAGLGLIAYRRRPRGGATPA